MGSGLVKDDVEVLFEDYPPPRAGQVSMVSDRKVTAKHRRIIGKIWEVH